MPTANEHRLSSLWRTPPFIDKPEPIFETALKISPLYPRSFHPKKDLKTEAFRKTETIHSMEVFYAIEILQFHDTKNMWHEN